MFRAKDVSEALFCGKLGYLSLSLVMLVKKYPETKDFLRGRPTCKMFRWSTLHSAFGKQN
jgi:hypothetical protein